MKKRLILQAQKNRGDKDRKTMLFVFNTLFVSRMIDGLSDYKFHNNKD